MNKAQASDSHARADMLVRDRDGYPKVDYNKIPRFWAALNDEDRELVCAQHPDHPYCNQE